jgi:methyltransferase (TIGR00027 family)
MNGQREAESLEGVAATSLVVAAARAAEQRRPDRLFEDPYAELFLRAAGDAREASAHGRAQWFLRQLGDQPAVRTAFFDDRLLRAAGAGCRQVVLLAAGMDTRAFRLEWPEGTRVFDVDFEAVSRFKQRVLDQARATPRCDHRPVAADLREDWGAALRAQGFSAERPTAWLAEGILYALPSAAADLLLERVTALSAPGSVFAADHIERSAALDSAIATISAELVGMWQSGPAGSLESWLTRHQWTPRVESLATVAGDYGRPVPAVFDPHRPGTSRGWLIAADLDEAAT